MNQKGIASIILVVVIVLLAGVVGYFTLVKKSPGSEVPQESSTRTNAPQLGNQQPTPTVQPTTSTEYRNTQYGFSFTLPTSWKGYLIVTSKWEGYISGGSQGDVTTEEGPMISIRHPQWTSQNPRQDIPIMVFTVNQWNSLQQDKFHIGAAPFNPSELGRNTKYIFALPARYNYEFPTGYEEVEKILQDKPLQAF